jgi:intermediate cleaving peptidase 55
MSKVRLIKSDAEITNMRLAGRISGRVFTNAMRQKWPGEKELRSFLEYQFKTNGCDSEAYVPVVASGEVRSSKLDIHPTINII